MQDITTAQMLINFRAELRDSGMPDYLVDDLVRMAAKEQLVSEGLVVKAKS